MIEKPNRHQWIDLLRGLAVVGMVWTHSANTFLQSSLQNTPGYHTLSFYHGLVAPIFFWVAGFMRGRSAAKVTTGPRKPAWPTVKRLLLIYGMGCLMHMPWNALVKFAFTSADWKMLFQCDVLNCLALSCLLLLAVERAMAGAKVKAWVVVLLLGLLAVLVTDRVEPLSTGFVPLDALLARRHGSLFPLFPWVGFACAGFVMGSFGVPSWRTALVASLLAFVLPRIPGSSGTLEFFLERLGWVVMIAAGIAALEVHMAKVPRWLLLAGRESLCLYVVHLMFIHAVPWWSMQTLEHLVGPTQPPRMVVVIFLALLVLSMLVAFGNEQRKQIRGKT